MQVKKQCHSLGCYGSKAFTRLVKTASRKINESNVIPVDQFFSLPQNQKDGFCDASVYAFANPQATSHLNPVSAERPLPKDMTDDEIHASVISKSCQTLSELAQLTQLRPRPEDYDRAQDIPVDDEPKEPSAPSAEE